MNYEQRKALIASKTTAVAVHTTEESQRTLLRQGSGALKRIVCDWVQYALNIPGELDAFREENGAHLLPLGWNLRYENDEVDAVPNLHIRRTHTVQGDLITTEVIVLADGWLYVNLDIDKDICNRHLSGVDSHHLKAVWWENPIIDALAELLTENDLRCVFVNIDLDKHSEFNLSIDAEGQIGRPTEKQTAKPNGLFDLPGLSDIFGR